MRISSFCVGKGSGNAEGSKGAGTRLRREGSKGSEGGGIAAFGGDEFYIPPAAATLPEAAKTIKPGLRPVGNAPLSPPAAVLPPEGEVCSPFLLVLTYVAHFIAPLESPPLGWQANTIRKEPQATENRVRRFPVERRHQKRQKGCISHARKGGLPVFPSPIRAVVRFFHTSAPSFPKGAHHPLNLLHPLHLLNPHARKGMSMNPFQNLLFPV